MLDALRDAIGRGAYAEAATLAHAAATREPGEGRWRDLAALLDALARAALVDAFVHAYGLEGLDPLDAPLHDLVLEQLAAALERSGEPLLAHALLQQLGDARLALRDQARLLRELEPALAERPSEQARSVAARVLAAAQGDATLVLLARARALATLERGEEALACVRKAAALDERLDLRMREAQLLGTLGRRDEQHALLEQLVERWPSADVPARALARLHADTPAAARWYALALARRFDAALTCEYAELLTRLRRSDEALALLEASHALVERSSDADPDASEQLARALVGLHRSRGDASEQARWMAIVEQRVAMRERGYAVMAIALMVTLLAIVLIAVIVL